MTLPRFLKIFVLLLLFISQTIEGKEVATDSLLRELDKVIAERYKYIAEKEKQLLAMRNKVVTAPNDYDYFFALGNLYTEYFYFNADSAYAISNRQEALANSIGDSILLINARLNKANVLSMTGLYNETLKLTDSINPLGLPDYLRSYYFHTKRTVYGNIAAGAVFRPEKEYYEILTEQNRDSLLAVYEPNSMLYNLIMADKLNVHNRPQEAIDLLDDFIKNNQLSEHDNAICAWTLSESYGRLGDTANQKKCLLISAISDMKSAVREYVSLRQLALMLYTEGDLDRAYKFLTIAVDDASKCNARQRIIELNDSYPMINGIYVQTVHDQNKALERTIFIIAVLLVIVICLLFYMRKQMKCIARERKKVEDSNIKLNELNSELTETNDKLNELNNQLIDANHQLNELNTQLTKSNNKLHEANCAISEISKLKEAYIGRYMDQSLDHIEMLDSFRKHIGKLLSSGKIDEVKKMVKSTSIVDDELNSFYYQFDQTFLSLFPTFVDDFNNLLLPEETITPKKEGSLNTELRIYALIRLGITDSDRIAKFLRYSLTTIYNYRTKVRNKAKGDRNQLEAEVIKIGQQL